MEFGSREFLTSTERSVSEEVGIDDARIDEVDSPLRMFSRECSSVSSETELTCLIDSAITEEFAGSTTPDEDESGSSMQEWTQGLDEIDIRDEIRLEHLSSLLFSDTRVSSEISNSSIQYEGIERCSSLEDL